METLFMNNLIINHPEKVDKINKGLEEGLVKEFDKGLITKLRRTFYSCLPATLYIYGFPTNEKTIAEKTQLLSIALGDDCEIVQGMTNSNHEIDQKFMNLETTTWIEMTEGNRTWVYDPFSLLKFEKNLFYEIEEPNIYQRIYRRQIDSELRKECEESYFYPKDDWIVPEMIKYLEGLSANSPYKDFILSEIDRLKIGYEIKGNNAKKKV